MSYSTELIGQETGIRCFDFETKEKSRHLLSKDGMERTLELLTTNLFVMVEKDTVLGSTSSIHYFDPYVSEQKMAYIKPIRREADPEEMTWHQDTSDFSGEKSVRNCLILLHKPLSVDYDVTETRTGIMDGKTYDFKDQMENIYFHSWKPGDTLIFDNRKVLHGRFPSKRRRAIHPLLRAHIDFG